MNELHRQTYLSALGLETYMPRFHLPFAPVSVACDIASVALLSGQSDLPVAQTSSVAQPVIPADRMPDASSNVSPNISPVGNLIGNIFDVPKVAKAVVQPTSAANILAQLNAKPIAVEPFNLSVWRPFDGLMIVDSRNTKLALPTELLLNNIMRTLFSDQVLKLQEEILRWPTIENSFATCSIADARNELQTWLSVQHEIRPIRYLWLMGANAATYLLSENTFYNDNIYKSVALMDSSIRALVIPSLNELLQNPAAKQQLYSALAPYHSVRL